MDDLFDFDVYPIIPGEKGGHDTGIAAARDMAPRAPVIRERVLAAVRAAGVAGLTPEEACEKLGLPRVAVQPRFSEGAALGKLVKSDHRRRNPSSGKLAVAWVVPEFAPEGGAR